MTRRTDCREPSPNRIVDAAADNAVSMSYLKSEYFHVAVHGYTTHMRKLTVAGTKSQEVARGGEVLHI